jgi:hypothetical protein
VIKDIMVKGHRPSERVIFDPSPKNLVKRIVEIVHAEKAQDYKYYRSPDHQVIGKGDMSCSSTIL